MKKYEAVNKLSSIELNISSERVLNENIIGRLKRFVILADELIELLPRGRAYLSDQLQRAALSISLNIAEGAGEYAADEKARFYRIAKRSATECAGALDVCQRLRLVEESRYIKGRELLIGIVSMLIKMAQKR